MTARMERVMNSENLGVRIMEKRGLRTYLELVLKNEGPNYKISKCAGTASWFTTISGAYLQNYIE
jgi:hypothetical protein